MKVLVFAASSSTKSINKQLAIYTANLIKGAELTILDLNDYELPIFSEDKESEIGKPELAKEFLDRIAQSDMLVISFAEHNGSYATAYKNIFDWASHINNKVFQNKPIILLATSPGPGGASNVLASATQSATFFDGEVIVSLSVPSFYKNFNLESKEIVNEEIREKITSITNKL